MSALDLGQKSRARPELRFLDTLGLPLGRAHEICGNARRLLAALIAAAVEGPVFWIAPSWSTDRLNPEALVPLFDPGRLIFVEPKRAEDLLWCLEEVLRSGAVPLAVADLPEPPGLTPVRRLHLAAETGAGEAPGGPLALLLTPGEGGAPGVETRWQISSAHRASGPPCWALHRLRARHAKEQSWRLRAEGKRFATAPTGAAAA
ncbi:MAG: hypothetical protein AAF748_02650 [Pseudomonadota bacterium]